MHAWIASHDVAYQAYFDHDAPDGGHELENVRFPAAAARSSGSSAAPRADGGMR
jgi:hypothetical protein